MTARLVLPPHLEAHEPPEARGLARDEVRLMVSFARNDTVMHTRFNRLPDFLQRGDVLVVNSSATLNAALTGTRGNGEAVEVHLSQYLGGDAWIIELRRRAAYGTAPLLDASVGEVVALPGGAAITLTAPYRDGHTRLWRAQLINAPDRLTYLERHGFPIRYGYVPEPWPLAYYQTIFARHPGSAEMPSAARAFSPRVLDALKRKGVVIVRIVLHTGVSSPEAHEPPYAEYYRVPSEAADAVNEARRNGSRVVAVGTTVVRALETVAARDGSVSNGAGWTDLVITPARGIYAVDALLTGFHEPQASHLSMLEALGGGPHIDKTYATALDEGYLWHEFGDLHLIFSAAVEPGSIDRRRHGLKLRSRSPLRTSKSAALRCNDGPYEPQLAGCERS
jgi:S-adenosylmethionine:tRNA ribosyltransferase-isomerase